MILGLIARIMAESAQKSKTNAKSKVHSFIWTDDEVELLLKVTIHSFIHSCLFAVSHIITIKVYYKKKLKEADGEKTWKKTRGL